MVRRPGRAAAFRLALAGLLALAAIVASCTTASAHVNFVGSDPADGSALGANPTSVALDFDKRVSVVVTTVTLVDAEGRQHAVTRVAVDPERDTRLVVSLPRLRPDTYRLSFVTHDVDDFHLTEGSVVFAIGAAPSLASQPTSFGAVSPVEVALRALGTAGIGAAVGGLLFLLAVLRRAPAAVAAQLRRRVGRMAVGGAAAALLAQLPLLVIQVHSLGAVAGGAWSLLTGTDYGRRWLVETTLLVALLASVVLVVRGRRPRRVLSAAAALLAVAVTVAAAVGGHTGGDSAPTTFGVLLRSTHLLAVDLWAGGLAALVLVAISLRRRPAGEVQAGTLHALATGYARWAAPAFAVLVITGLVLAGAEVATVTALLSTAYGLILVAKVGLVGVVAVVAARHRGLLTRRTRQGGDHRLASRLRLSLPVEAGLAMFIVVLAAALASSPPARGPQFDAAPPRAPSSMAANADDLLVQVSLRPNLPGRNLLTVDVLNSRRPAPGPIRDVRLELRRPGEATPRVVVAVHSVDQQSWDGGVVNLASAGDLRVGVSVDRADLPVARTQLAWTVNPNLPPPPPTVVSDTPIAPLADTAAVVLGLLLAILTIRRWRTGGRATLSHATAWLAEHVFPGSAAAQWGLRRLRGPLRGEPAGRP